MAATGMQDTRFLGRANKADYFIASGSRRDELARDFRGTAWVPRLTHSSDFQGYRLMTILGYQWRPLTRKRVEPGDQTQPDNSRSTIIHADVFE